MTLMRPFVSLPSAPQAYSMQDQNALRRALAQALDSVTNVTSNQVTALTGDVTGSGTGSIVTTLAASQPNITTAANLTTIGTLIAGAVPASLVTAGTFGAGNYATAGTLAVAAGATTNALTVTTTGAIQASLRYDASTRLDVSVAASTGLATYALSVSGNVNTRHYFTEPMEISASGTTLYTTGLGVSINKQGSSTDAELVGASVIATWSSSGAVTDLVGLRTNPILGGGGGTIVNAISQRVSALTASCTTAYGLLVDAITGGATNYALYTNAGRVRFGDVVDFTAQQSLNFVIENRTSDPGSPAVGQLWLRTDL
mgnify:FL=1